MCSSSLSNQDMTHRCAREGKANDAIKKGKLLWGEVRKCAFLFPGFARSSVKDIYEAISKVAFLFVNSDIDNIGEDKEAKPRRIISVKYLLSDVCHLAMK
ncbi:hypothetical protein CEXT_527961 [Caerostris extrusa]|uniref:Uncharacterized protein n=1 Tax=Caerostris extrusa TaxID=172846 RepID=A0AAV4XCL9_CAEEX|nr:hypothetical protein CEXT_527961 [Caerostris extrusa]